MKVSTLKLLFTKEFVSLARLQDFFDMIISLWALSWALVLALTLHAMFPKIYCFRYFYLSPILCLWDFRALGIRL